MQDRVTPLRQEIQSLIKDKQWEQADKVADEMLALIDGAPAARTAGGASAQETSPARSQNNPAAPAPRAKGIDQGPIEYSRQPDFKDVAYGPHEQNVFDLWLAKSARPTPLVIHFHGGGFNHGDKTRISPALLEICLARGISVATANYRLAPTAIYPAQLQDSARVIQFLRFHAKKWNLNPKAIAVTGGSAGGVISMWLGFFDDMADPANADPVKRESTRPAVIGPVDGQSTVDARVLAKLIGDAAARDAGTYAATRLFGLPPDANILTATNVFPLYEEASPVNHIKAGATPTFAYYNHPPGPLPPRNPDEGLHNFRFGLLLKERLDQVGVECVLRHAGDYPGPDRPIRLHTEMVEFFVKHFPKEAGVPTVLKAQDEPGVPASVP